MVFNYVIKVAIYIAVVQCQFYTLESDLIGYPIQFSGYQGNLQSGNIYNYDINNYGINSLIDNFIIGTWVQTQGYYYGYNDRYLIMQINSQSINIIMNYDFIEIFQFSYGLINQNPIFYPYNWAYVYYKQNLQYGYKQICVSQINYGTNYFCIQLPDQEYYLFSFFQTTSTLWDYFFGYYIYPFSSQAISITIKKMQTIESSPNTDLDLITLMSYVEPEVILDLRIYERYQTKILKDWSDYQHIVQLGFSLDDDIYDPQIIINDQLLSFTNQQYIKVENFKVAKSVTIEFQLLNIDLPDQLTIFAFSQNRLQREIINISANFMMKYIYINFVQQGLSFDCQMIFGEKFLLGIVNLVYNTKILFIQNDQIICLYDYMGEFYLKDIDSLNIGSYSNYNSQPFYLTSVRISNGFYSPQEYIYNGICAYSINQCYYCLNGYYLYQGQCLFQCPTYYEINYLRKECIPKCHPTCLDCDQANPAYCYICAGIRINAPDCKCPTGYFDDGISPDCIQYLPDQTVDEGTFEFQCYSLYQDQTYSIDFSKNYQYPPYVAISLLTHIDYYDSNEFQVFVSSVYNNYFYLRIICNSYNAKYKIQWVAGKSQRFYNVIQTDYSGQFSSFQTYHANQYTISGGILGWCLQQIFEYQVDLYLQQIGISTFYFTANQFLYMLKYQLFEFTDFVYYSFNYQLNPSTQQQGFSIGGDSVIYGISTYPLTIPTLLQIKRIQTFNSYNPQFTIEQKKRPGQIELKFRTIDSKYIDYFVADLIYLIVSCNDPYQPCDYIQELQKCNVILSGCSCNSNQYLDQGQNICIDCDPNCSTCQDNKKNCQSCTLESQKQLTLDIYSSYYTCQCATNQYEDINGVCQDCDPNCQQCLITATYCMSCGPNQVINMNYSCECQFGSTLTELGCEICQPPCNTCETTITNCLSCFYPGQVTPTCQCPTGQQVVDGQCIQYCPLLCLDCSSQTSCNQCVNLSTFNQASNACECQSGYFSNSIECQQCQSPCLNCNSLTSCTSCINQTYYIDITCIQCISPCLECTASNYCLTCIDDSYYLSSGQCLPCQSPCLTCLDIMLCKSCINDSYYFEDAIQQCSQCISPCLTCQTDVYCKTCINTFYYLSSSNTCLNCVSPCQECSSETQCINCISGYYIDANNICQACVSPCSLCSTLDICSQCLGGYFLDANYTCQSCLDPCLTCLSLSTNCLSCTDPTMLLTNGSCSCASNQYYDSTNSICQNCHPTCTTCSNSNDCCLITEFKHLNTTTNLCDCQDGYYMSLNICTPCTSPCVYCTNSSVCTTCIDGYYLSGTSCLICTSPCSNCVNTSTQCLSCVSINMIITNYICTCPTQYYMDSAQTDCIQCHPTCLTCSDSSNCCFSTEHKILDSITNVCKCIDGYYFDSNGICQQCDINCLTCETTSTNCLSCDTKFQLVATECKCLLSNQFINNLNLCENCSTNCLTCSINANNCLSCDETKKYQLINNVCQCKTNEYLNENGVCTQCHNTCASCVNGTEIGCLACISSRKMNPENKLCECANGYFQNDNFECVKCSSKCGKCVNDHECLTCSENRSLNGVLCICNNGFFENDKQLCQKCSPPCSNCTNASDCLSCIDVNREVVESRCICSKGFFENEQNQCESCSSIRGKVNDICNYVNCGDGELTKGEQCDDGNKNSRDGCTDCKIDSLFTCVNKMLSRSICFQCVPHCQTCSLKGFRSSCDLCYDGYYLKNNECIKCSDMCYTCQDNKTCLTCTIIEAKPDEIGTCPKCTNVKGYYIINRKCVTKCGDSILVEGELCDDGNNLDGDGCDSKCQVEKYYTCKESTCTKIPQPEVGASYTNSTTSDSMVLNFPIDQGDPCTKINITIDQFLPNDFQSFINYEQVDENNSKCNIDFSFNKTIDLGNLIHIYIPVKVRTSRRVLDEEETREIIITPRKKVIYSQNQVQQAESASNAQSALGEMMYFIAPSVIILGGFNFFWTIMDILSWINNLYYINIYFPENVRMFFQKSAWGDFQLFPAFFVLNEPTDPYYIESPKKFMEKGVDPIFLNNTWTCFAIIAITIAVYILSCLTVLILELIWPPPIQTKTQLSSVKIFQLNETKPSHSEIFQKNAANKFTKIKNQSGLVDIQNQITVIPKKRFPFLIGKIYQPMQKFKVNFFSNFIKSLNLAFLDLVLAIILQITTVPSYLMDYQIVFINQILSYVSISVCVFILIVSYYVTTKHYMLLDHEIFQNQYGTLYENINTKSRTAMMYSFINLNRKALFIIVVVYFYYQPLLQTVFSCFISFLNIALILYENPFTSNADLIQNGIPDFCIFVLMLLSTGFALDDIICLLSADQRFQIGWLMIGTIGLSIFVQVIFLLREFINDLKEKFLIISKKIQNCLQSKKKQ